MLTTRKAAITAALAATLVTAGCGSDEFVGEGSSFDQLRLRLSAR